MRYPLSFAQRRSRGRASPLSCAAWLDGPLDPDALRRALDVVVARHPVLRTRFTDAEQVVAPTGGVVVEHVVLPGGPDDVARAEAIASDLAARPFDLGRAPLLRVALVELGPERRLFALAAHEVVADAAAVGVLLADLAVAYRGGPPAPAPWMDYGDYALWQRERLRGEELERLLDHWRAVLRDAPPAMSFERGPGGRLTAAVPAATSPVELLAAYAVVLARHTGQADLVIAVPVSGRTRVELEPIVGPFADAVPVRVSVAGTSTFAELLARVRDAAETALAHDEVPLDLLAEELGLDLRDDAVRFAFRPPEVPAPDFPGVRSRVLPVPADGADLDLVAGEDGVVTLAHRVDPRFAEWLLGSVVAVVEEAGRAPDTPLSDLPLLPVEGAAFPTAAFPTGAPRRTRPAADDAGRSAAHDPAPLAGDAPTGGGVPSRDGIERTMAEIWAELLRTTEPIGAHDNLFGRGGGSLTAVRFASRIADAYGVVLPMDRIITSPTIAALAEFVSAELAPADDVEAGLAALSDAELDDLLRAVTATRDRRRTAEGDTR
ncbi:condensation domain-containing protein [Saccharothrix longispora]|uniref:Acyl carrier protein n=1 Tax=Saccharothrix longispora TaxID=33920 RepID=A0ABU1PUK9_9PSEU|nr:condensation domain-containing protein [Saccharothrix longispora]MDR6594340.1 acyl carrier protein [Saccharothrix longispora]